MNRKSIALSIMAAIALAGNISRADNRNNAIYGIYTETYSGIKYDIANPPDSDGAKMGLWPDGTNTKFDKIESDVKEGSVCGKVTVKAGNNGGGVYMEFGYPSSQIATNMQAYTGGSLNFWIKTGTEVEVKIVWLSGSAALLVNKDLGIALDNQWHWVSVPLSRFSCLNSSALNTIVQPVVFSAAWANPAPAFDRYFYIDNVFWSTATGGTPKYDAVLKNDNGSDASGITWSGVNPGNTLWKKADQHIELSMDSYFNGWGIQIYTDNKASDALPRYTGTGSAAGLVDTANTTQSLPMCWRIVDVATSSNTIQQGAAGYPDRLWAKEHGDQYPCFFWMLDRGDTKFANGSDYVTVWNNNGIHHAEGTNWGGAVSPNLIYLGANFTNALGSRTYKTGKLVIELFNE